MTLVILSISGLIIGGAFVFLFWALFRREGLVPANFLDWLEEFSVARYRPMERLLNSADYTFLAAQPGFVHSIVRRLRRERLRLFQAYLRNMIRDFHRLLKIARWVMVYSSTDESAFAGELWRLRWRFYGLIASVEFNVALSVVGLARVDASRLVAALERMQSFTLGHLPELEAA